MRLEISATRFGGIMPLWPFLEGLICVQLLYLL